MQDKWKHKLFSGSPFSRAVATLASGTIIAQLISVLSIPIITRLYTPDAFGQQGIFLSIVNILAAIATLGYHTSIVLPDKDSDSINLTKLSIYLSVATSTLVFLVVYQFGGQLLTILNAESLAPIALFIPLGMLFLSTNTVLTLWLTRKKEHKLMAGCSILSSFLVNSGKIGLGFIYPYASALVSITISAKAILSGVILQRQREFLRGIWTPQPSNDSSITELAVRYKEFPIYKLPQTAINVAAQSLPVILLAAYFGAKQAGFYSLAIGILGLPIMLIGNSIASVFLPLITEKINNGEKPRKEILSLTKKLMMLGLAPLLIIVIFGPVLFATFFGGKWETSGVYAQILAPLFYIQLLTRPAISAIPGLRLQKSLLIYEILSLTLKITSLWVGFTVFNDDVLSLGLFSIAGIASYACLIIWVIYKSK